MRRKSPLHITLTAAFAALYAVGVVFLAPISFQIFQVRLADAMLPLAIIFGWPAIIGLALGAFVANFFGGLGPVDIIGGALANLLATFLAWKISQLNSNKMLKLVGVGVEIIVVTSIVGAYLSFLFGMPLQVGLLGVFLGSLIATGILGTILLSVFSTSRVTAMLKSHGLIKE